jgi:hypothetical protein
MLRIRNMCTLVFGAILLAGIANVQADSHLPAATSAKSQAAPAAPCKTYKPCVEYRGCCDCCGPKVSQVLKVKDPCDCCCCLAEIPVCLPACCKNPCVDCRCGWFGRGIVTYSYNCGCCVTIVFTRCGDVIVKYS